MKEKTTRLTRPKKFKIDTKKKIYQISDSPFYKLSSKKRLAELLQIDIQELQNLASDDHYRVFEDNSGRKPRQIEQPLHRLDKVHTRIASLLCRISTPKYLHSGIKGRTYITNAKQHLGFHPVLTTDIRSFFPSTTRRMVESFFLRNLKCAPDIAFLLSNIVTYDGHVPTGSRLSMPIAFWANYRMFEDLYIYSLKNDVTMTVYVDDLCFSGGKVNYNFYRSIQLKIESSGHELHNRKTKLYSSPQHKMITGVSVHGNQIKVANGKLKDIYEDTIQWILTKDKFALNSLQNRLLGRMSAQGQIDFRFKDKARSFRERVVNTESSS